MQRDELRKRIVVNPLVPGDKAMIRSAGISVESIVATLASGEDVQNLLATHPRLEPEDIMAALLYASGQDE